MKKLVLSLILIASLSIPALAAQSDYYWPWQHVSKVKSGTTLAVVTIEPTAYQNVVIDRIIANSDLSTSKIVISTYPRGAAGFSTTETVLTTMLNPSNVATTGAVYGGQNAEIPLFVVDRGLAVQIALTGTSNCSLIANCRRADMPLKTPSAVKGY